MKQLLTFLTFCVVSASASALDFVIPYSTGGSTSLVLHNILPAIKAVGVDADVRYVGNCRMAQAQLTGKPQLYFWSNDLECATPTVDPTSFVALFYWTPLYLCGRQDNLSAYKTGNVKLAVNVGPLHSQLGGAIRAAMSTDMRVISYANTGAIKTSLVTNEVDLVLTTIGPALVAEGLAKCYAASTNNNLAGLVTLKSITGDVANSVYFATGWISAQGMAPADLKNIQNAVQEQMRTAAYRDLIVGKMKRELPDATVEQQIHRVTQSLQLNK
jgi:hypothetical protein